MKNAVTKAQLIASRNAFLQTKNLPIWPQETLPSVDDGIEVHSNWLMEQIYSQPYKRGGNREHHGYLHVNRAAIWIPIFVNLYRAFTKDCDSLTNTDIKLLQVAALLHDSARENDAEDKWDTESGTLIFYYLTTILNIDIETAISYAQTAANKDYHEKQTYFVLQLSDDGSVSWKETTVPETVSVDHDLIHDVDCLDYKRCGSDFDGTYLTFYRKHACNDENALSALGAVIREADHYQGQQGDALYNYHTKQKLSYEKDGCYVRMQSELLNGDFPMCALLYNNMESLANAKDEVIKSVSYTAYDPNKPFTADNAFAAMMDKNIILLLRGIRTPSRQRVSTGPESYKAINYILDPVVKSFVETELYKAQPRTNGKTCNPQRSTTLWAGGVVDVPASVFFILTARPEDITDAYYVDGDTGFAQKLPRRNKPTTEKIIQAINKLRVTQLLGGKTRLYPDKNIPETNFFAARHNEILNNTRLKYIQAIGYSDDGNIINMSASGNPKPFHPLTPLLEAIYTYQSTKQTTGKELPIFKIDTKTAKFDYVPLPTDEKLIQIWQEVIDDYFRSISIDEINLVHSYPLRLRNHNLYTDNLSATLIGRNGMDDDAIICPLSLAVAATYGEGLDYDAYYGKQAANGDLSRNRIGYVTPLYSLSSDKVKNEVETLIERYLVHYLTQLHDSIQQYYYVLAYHKEYDEEHPHEFATKDLSEHVEMADLHVNHSCDFQTKRNSLRRLIADVFQASQDNSTNSTSFN